MADPLPAIPLWFSRVTEGWQAYEQFHGVLGATQRRKQLERLKQSYPLEISCRTYGPGVVKLWARLRPDAQDLTRG